jgi:hypothetical protein
MTFACRCHLHGWWLTVSCVACAGRAMSQNNQQGFGCCPQNPGSGLRLYLSVPGHLAHGGPIILTCRTALSECHRRQSRAHNALTAQPAQSHHPWMVQSSDEPVVQDDPSTTSSSSPTASNIQWHSSTSSNIQWHSSASFVSLGECYDAHIQYWAQQRCSRMHGSLLLLLLPPLLGAMRPCTGHMFWPLLLKAFGLFKLDASLHLRRLPACQQTLVDLSNP